MAMGNLPSSRGRQRRAPMAEINVTPLVDVMLVLLIIFMVTAPLLVSGVPVDLPDSNAKGLDQGGQPLQISLDKEGNLFLNAEPARMEDLPTRLSQVAQKVDAQGPQVYLRADKGLTHGKVMAVMGEVNAAGISRVAIVTTSGEGQ